MMKRKYTIKLLIAILAIVSLLVTLPTAPARYVYALEGAETEQGANHEDEEASEESTDAVAEEPQAENDSKDADAADQKDESPKAEKSSKEKSTAKEEYVEEIVTEDPEDDAIEATVYTDNKMKKELKRIRITVSGDIPDDAEVVAYPVDVDIDGEETYAAYQLLIYDARGKEIHSTAKDGKSITVTIYDSKATNNGGGVYNAGTVTMVEDPDQPSSNLLRGSFENCSAKNGGGIYTTGSLTMTGGAIENCTATNNGGGMYVAIPAGSTDKVQMSVVTNHPGVINNCTATGNGGGIYIESGELDLNGGTLKMCKANNGGGIYNNGKLIIDGTSNHPGTIEDCWATNNGGAIYDNSSTQIEIHRITINGHVNLPAATVNAKNGGGIYLPNLGTNGVAPAALTVDSDSKLYNLTASADGGAIYNAANARNSLTDKTTVNVKNTVIDGHYNGFDTSTVNAKRGGSIFMQSGWLTVENTTISNSAASGDGGAIYNMPPATFVINDCTVNMTGVTITNSVAVLTNATNGGGVFMKMGVLSLTDCTINGLNAGSGAAIYARTNDSGSTAAQVTITNGMIENNTATAAGGGAINTLTSGSALAKITFEGNTKVTGNKNSSDDTTHEHNMVLSHDANTVINSPGLGSSAKIGVYVVDTALTEGKTIFTEHGEEGDPFGTYSGTDPQNLNKFVNDRNNLTAMKGTSNNQIIWSTVPAPTGVNLRILPWILIALAGGALLMVFRRRRNV